MLENWLLFVATTLVFMSTPGPSHILMLSNSATNGLAKSAFTALGDLSANLIQMTAAGLGLAGLVWQNPNIFSAIKWAGITYLAVLGIVTIQSRAKPHHLSASTQRSRSSLYWQGFFTSMSNPKAILFFAALFPQFISSSYTLWTQLAVLSLSYLLIDGAFLLAYGKFAEFFSKKYIKIIGPNLNRLSGGLYLLAAVLLSLKSLDLST